MRGFAETREMGAGMAVDNTEERSERKSSKADAGVCGSILVGAVGISNL